MLAAAGLQELYKSHTFVFHQCQVKSIDLKIMKSNFYPRWNITVLHENQTRNDSLIGSLGSSSESQAWSTANEYKINETYPCYRSENDISVIDWGWQWNKPSRLKGGTCLLSGITFVSIGAMVMLLRRRYQQEFQITQQHQQPEIQLRNV